jgi:hypothetical protein
MEHVGATAGENRTYRAPEGNARIDHRRPATSRSRVPVCSTSLFEPHLAITVGFFIALLCSLAGRKGVDDPEFAAKVRSLGGGWGPCSVWFRPHICARLGPRFRAPRRRLACHSWPIRLVLPTGWAVRAWSACCLDAGTGRGGSGEGREQELPTWAKTKALAIRKDVPWQM